MLKEIVPWTQSSCLINIHRRGSRERHFRALQIGSVVHWDALQVSGVGGSGNKMAVLCGTHRIQRQLVGKEYHEKLLIGLCNEVTQSCELFNLDPRTFDVLYTFLIFLLLLFFKLASIEHNWAPLSQALAHRGKEAGPLLLESTLFRLYSQQLLPYMAWQWLELGQWGSEKGAITWRAGGKEIIWGKISQRL